MFANLGSLLKWHALKLNLSLELLFFHSRFKKKVYPAKNINKKDQPDLYLTSKLYLQGIQPSAFWLLLTGSHALIKR